MCICVTSDAWLYLFYHRFHRHACIPRVYIMFRMHIVLILYRVKCLSTQTCTQSVFRWRMALYDAIVLLVYIPYNHRCNYKRRLWACLVLHWAKYMLYRRSCCSVLRFWFVLCSSWYMSTIRTLASPVTITRTSFTSEPPSRVSATTIVADDNRYGLVHYVIV